ncbi:MAG: hypothetical protein IJ746_07570 [Ruminococcus sp.]|nr:hypothetical protein [Ruminococcus sp.]
MSLFGSKKPRRQVPEECRGMKVKIESSTCTGEKTIGFFDPVAKRLLYTELVRSDEDVAAFYEKYGLSDEQH